MVTLSALLILGIINVPKDIPNPSTITASARAAKVVNIRNIKNSPIYSTPAFSILDAAT